MQQLMADPAWRSIELLSDVHLSPDMPATFDAWATHLQQTDADALLILGDLFEVWVGDDAIAGPFEARCLQVLAAAAAPRTLAFMPGNRDFLLGTAARSAGRLAPLADPTALVAFGRRVVLTHGDALCLDDVEYQRFRREVRSIDWQRRFLALPLDERRRIARAMRDASDARQRAQASAWHADVDVQEASRWLDEAAASALIHGHTHRPADLPLPGGRERHVLSDWNFEHGARRGDVLRITAQGIERIAPRTRG